MTAFARLRKVFLPDREPDRALFCTYGFDAGFFEAELLPALLPRSLSFDRQAGSKQAYQRAADVALLTKGVAVSFDHLSGEGPELIYDTWRVDVTPRCFHAKLAVLDYGDVIRVVVNSANISRAAWSSLLELFVVEDLRPGTPHGWSESLSRFLGRLSRDHVAGGAPDVAGELAVRLGLVPHGPGGSRLVSSWDAPIIDALLDGIERARRVDVVTPFFEGDEGEGLFDALAQRLGTRLRGSIWTTVEQIADRAVVRGPEEKLRPLLSSGRWELNAVSAVWEGDEEDATLRALHGKLIAIEHGRQARVVVGSPNATRAALLNRAPVGNVELGVVSDLPTRRLAEILPQGSPVALGDLEFAGDGDPTGEDAPGELGAERWVRAATYSARLHRLSLALDPAAPPLVVRYADQAIGRAAGAGEWSCDLAMGAERYVTVDDGTSSGTVPFVIVDPARLEPRWTAREASFEDFCDVLAGYRDATAATSDELTAPRAGFGIGEDVADVTARGPIPWRRYLAAVRGIGHELECEATFLRGLAFVLSNPARLAGLVERLDRARELGRFTAADLAYALYELEREVRRASSAAEGDRACVELFAAALADLGERRERSIAGASRRLKRQLALLTHEDRA